MRVRDTIIRKIEWHCERAHVWLAIDCVDKAMLELDEARRLRAVLKDWPTGEDIAQVPSAPARADRQSRAARHHPKTTDHARG